MVVVRGILFPEMVMFSRNNNEEEDVTAKMEGMEEEGWRRVGVGSIGMPRIGVSMNC